MTDRQQDAGDGTAVIRGTALDDHAGAVIVRTGDRDVYVDGLRYWPREARGRTIEATGHLCRRGIGVDSLRDEDGNALHGQPSGDVLYLEEPTWRVVD